MKQLVVSRVIAGVILGAGLAFSVDWLFPRGSLRAFIHDGVHKLSLRYSSADETLSRQYFKDHDRVSSEREIDTALLPLKVKMVRLSEYYPIPKSAGSITAIGNTAIILDRLGNFYACSADGNNIIKLAFPELPNNINDYVDAAAHGGTSINDRKFRAHDIEYMEFAKSIAVSHEYFDKKHKRQRHAVSIIHVDVDDGSIRSLGSWDTIFRSGLQRPSNVAAGGRMTSRAPDKLYLGIGDYMIEHGKFAQDEQSAFGKILEIRIDTRESTVISTGHRNPQGLLMTSRGALYSTEHGPYGGDELNLIANGGNYGWPSVTLGTDYGKYGWQNVSHVGGHEQYRLPMFAWVPSIAVSNLIEVQDFNPRWNGDLLVGSLKGESLMRLRLDENRILYAEPIWLGQRIRDIAQLKNGTIVLWTDDTQLHFISVDDRKLGTNRRPTQLLNEALDQKCMYCHHFGSTNATHFAPSLSNLFARRIASDNFRYSAALRNKEEKWREETLRDFLTNPEAFASGTVMPNPDVNQRQIEEIIQALKTAGAAED